MSLGYPISNGTVAPKIDSFTFPQMGASTTTANVPGFVWGLSQIIGFVRTISAGNQGNPYVSAYAGIAPGGVAPGNQVGTSITINSTSAPLLPDLSTYTMYFITPTASGLLP